MTYTAYYQVVFSDDAAADLARELAGAPASGIALVHHR